MRYRQEQQQFSLLPVFEQQRELLILWIFIPAFLIGTLVPISGRADSKSLKICVLDTGSGSNHEKKVNDVLNSSLSGATGIKVVSHPIYESNGDLKSERFVKALESSIHDCDIINLSWNLPSSEKTKKIEDKLTEAADRKILIGASGAPDGAITKPLDTTVMGKIQNAFLIAELNHQNHLDLTAYYGEQIFTALPVDDKVPGSSFTAPRFAATLAKWMIKNQSYSLEQVKFYLRTAKLKSKEKYPDLFSLGISE